MSALTIGTVENQVLGAAPPPPPAKGLYDEAMDAVTAPWSLGSVTLPRYQWAGIGVGGLIVVGFVVKALRHKF